MPLQPLFSPMHKYLFFILLLGGATAQAGVVIGGTRFIYTEGRQSVDVPVSNNSAQPWLINSKILSAQRWQGAETPVTADMPFVVTPPLFELAAGQENTVRLIRTATPLPGDRESLFTLSVAAIPSGRGGSHSVQMAIRSALKLIYRPAKLKGDPQQAYGQLRWSRSSAGVTVQNPTPFYITLFMVRVNGQPIDDAGVVAPFASRHLTWCQRAANCQLQWQTLNDYGRVMPAQYWHTAP